MDSLQQLCLAEIALSFNRFFKAHKTTTNATLKKGLRLLQRAYSEELASILGKMKELREEHADFVFNNNLKSLNTDWLEGFSWEAIVAVFQRIGPNLKKVTFDHHHSFHHFISAPALFSYLPNVTDIIYKHLCNDDVLESIAKYCHQLEKLNVTGSENVFDVGLGYFYKTKKSTKRRNRKHLAETNEGDRPFPPLKEVNVQFTSVEGRGIEVLLKNFPSLQLVDYSGLPTILHKIHRKHLHLLDKVERYNLINLDLTDCSRFAHYDDILKVCATLCPNLKTFVCPVSKLEHLNLCSMLAHVRNLDLCFTEESRMEVSDFLKWKSPKLTRLSLSKCIVSFSVLCDHCLHLEELRLHGVTLLHKTDFTSTCYDLRRFTVSGVDLTGGDTCKAIGHILTSSPFLEHLDLPGCDLSNSEMKANILKCCEKGSLKSINLSETNEEFLRDILVTCPSLETMTLYVCSYEYFELITDLHRLAATLPNTPLIEV